MTKALWGGLFNLNKALGRGWLFNLNKALGEGGYLI